MRNLISVIALVLASGLAHADPSITAIDNGLLGAWRSVAPVGSGNGIDFYIAGNFKADATADMSLICHYPDGEELEAVVTIPYSAENGKVQVLAEGTSSINKNGRNCDLSVEKSATSYSIQGDSLILTTDDGRTLNMARRR